MILTEEQREALSNALDYIHETELPVSGICEHDIAVLQAVVDSSDQIVEPTKLIELLAAGEHEQWAAWAQNILDTEPVLSENRKARWPGLIATPYEELSEEWKEWDRREVYLRSGAALAEIERLRAENLELQVAVIGPDGIRAHQACIITDQAARISDLEIEIAELKADLEQSERVIEARLDVIDQQAARIEELEDENATLTVLGKKKDWKPRAMPNQPVNEYASFVFIINDGYQIRKWVSKKGEYPSTFLARILNEKQGSEGMWQEYLLDELDLSKPQVARIKDLEDALVEAKAAIKFCLDEGDEDENYGPMHDLPEWRELPEKDKDIFRDWCRKRLQADGKIGPDVDAKPHCWQITEERKAALSAMSSLRTDVDCPQCDAWLHFSDIAEHAPVLRTMLTEAGL